MKKQFLKSRPVCKVTFALPKEATQEAKSVLLLGEFNSWNKGIELQAQKDGSYQAQLELETGREYQFRYLIDNERWENDWSADNYVPSPFAGVENSVVNLPKTASEKSKAVAKKKTSPKTKAKKSTKVAGADDLKKIEGVGPKLAQLLAEAGITNFAELAKASQAKLKAVLEAAGSRYKMHDPSTWPKQAKLAQSEKWAELKTLQASLKGGKKK